MEPDRGEVWLVDMGYIAKTRPCLVLGIPSAPTARATVAVVPHTTSLRTSPYEIAIPKRFLKDGAFGVQGIAPAPRIKFIRKLGDLLPEEMATIEHALRDWLRL